MSAPLQTGARRFAGRVFQLIRPYWTRSDERIVAWVLLVAIIGISLGLVYLSVLLNQWSRGFFNALEQKSLEDFRALMLYFCFIAAIYITASVYRAYLRQMLQMRWRLWLTRQYLASWLDHQVYYRIEQNPRGTDNPDQRIADDLYQFTAATLTLTLDLLQQLVTLASFVVILWGLSDALQFTALGREWTISGYLVWAALGYAILGTAFTYYVGRPLVRLNFQREGIEANLRFSLVRLREYAEGVALYRGEAPERANLEQRIDGIRLNWNAIMLATKRLNFLTVGYAQIATVFPYFVAGPRYFAGQIPLGGLTQIASAFGTVQESLSWFVQNYPSLATWKASADRLLTFNQAIADADREAVEKRGVKVDAVPAAAAIEGEHIDVRLPDGRTLLADGSFRFAPGERTLITGASGSGKSTLFRAIAGIWPYGAGHVRIPEGKRVMFLPQKPYLPIGTLADAVTYPAPAGSYPDTAIREALAASGLAPLAERLAESRNWSQTLSGGEQQKVAIARALLARPDYLFLDEATASTDEPTERALYEMLQARLPDAAIVSIAHRSQVAAFHTARLRLTGAALMPG